MHRPLRPWLLITPLSALGVLVGHELAYALTRTPREELHGYLSHLPELGLLLALLTLLGASFVERGARIALWPFPAVAITGFVVQEHVERLAHTGSLPFLLDKPVFLVGLGLQAVVAIVAWLCARLLVRVVGATGSKRRNLAFSLFELVFCPFTRPRVERLAGATRSRAPPIDR